MRRDKTDFGGFPISEIARLCRVSLKTAQRWKAGTTCPPSYALLILRADLGALSSDWAGWTIRKGLLVSPEGFEVSAADVRSYPFMRMQISTYQTENRKLREAAPQLEDQPDPATWPKDTWLLKVNDF